MPGDPDKDVKQNNEPENNGPENNGPENNGPENQNQPAQANAVPLEQMPNAKRNLVIVTAKDLKNIGFSAKEIEKISKKSEKEKEALFVEKAEKNRDMMMNAPRLPLWLKGTGNVKVIDQTFRVYGEQFSTAEKAFLLRHRSITEKIEAVQSQRNQELEEGKVPENYQTKVEVADNGETAFLPDVHLNEFQTSPNGCWSVSMMLQLQAKGVQYSQEEIRDFRPSHKNSAEARGRLAANSGVEDKKKKSEAAKTDQAYHSNQGNNFMEMGDAVISMAPDSMIHEVEYARYDAQIRQMGISRTQYVDNVTADLRKTILHAVKEDHAPVSFLNGGHYLTITGIDKDNMVTLKDSQAGNGRTPDQDIKVPLRTLVSRLINTGIQASWLGDINLAKDGKTIYGIPSKYTEMNPDGTIVDQPGDLSSIATGETVLQNAVGKRIYRTGADEDRPETLQNGVIKTEKVYLPKELNVASLTEKAKHRSNEAEQHLKEVSQSFYNVDTEHRPEKEGYGARFGNAVREQEAKEKAQQLESEGRMLANIQNAKNAAAAEPAKPASSREKAFDDYISNMLTKAKAETNKWNQKQYLARAILADQCREAGQKLPAGGFNATQAQQCSQQLKLHKLTEEQVGAAIQDGVSLKAARESIMDEMYRVPAERCENFIRDMKELSKVMKSKKDRSPEYQKFFDAVEKAGRIDPKSDNVLEETSKANQEIMKGISTYINGKEKVRFRSGGQERFNNAMDALSLVYMYTPTLTERIQGMMDGINKKRDVKKISSKDFVEVTKFGLERAQRDFAKRNEKQVNVTTQKTTAVKM
ncbi:MAG: hypothetical protein K6E75_02175 [Lachnospiraceae bacterium]|nr:hypothetical protein [Lachnospiraceae bacterium]